MTTWWIDEPRLLGGSHPSDADLLRLYGEGARVIICLLDDTERPAYDVVAAARLGYARHSIPIPDFHAPSLAQIEQFLSLVRDAAADATVLVHCEGGIGRTGTMAAAYWISQGLSASDAITSVRKARRYAVESDKQRAVLEQFAASRIQRR